MTREEIFNLVRTHPAWGMNYLGGTAGFTEPDLGEFEIFELAECDHLKSRGIFCEGKVGSACRIAINKASSNNRLRITQFGHSNNLLVVGEISKVQGLVRFEGRNHLFVMGAPAGPFHTTTIFRDHNSAIIIGCGATSNQTTFLADSGKSIQIGDDAMFAVNTEIRTSDSHALVSLDSKEQVNMPKSVVLERHVWLGANSIIMKGVRVGKGSVVGYGSVLTNDIPHFSAVAGSPARVVRDRVTWTRSAHPSISQIDSAIGAE